MSNNKKSEASTAWLPIGMCLGISIGTAIGAATNNMGMWMCYGVAIGVGIGAMIDNANRKKSADKPTDDAQKDENTEK